MGALRRDALAADVPATLPHMPGDAFALEALHRRLVEEHRRLESHQLQHEIRAEDIDDDMPGHCAAGLHGLAVDHRILDAETVRKVGFIFLLLLSSYINACNICNYFFFFCYSEFPYLYIFQMYETIR